MGFSLDNISKKGSSLISTARDKLPVGLRSAKSKEAYNGVKDNAPQNRPNISPINTAKDGSLFIYAKTLLHKPTVKIPNNLTAEGLKKFLDKTDEQLEKIKSGNSNLYVSGNGVIKENKPNGSKVLPFNGDTPQTPIEKPLSKKADFLKEHNIQKSWNGKLSFKTTINNTEDKLYIPKEFHSSPRAILASKKRIEDFVKKINDNSIEAKGYYIKNGKIFKGSLEEVSHTYHPNGIESDPVTVQREEWINKQVK